MASGEQMRGSNSGACAELIDEIKKVYAHRKEPANNLHDDYEEDILEDIAAYRNIERYEMTCEWLSHNYDGFYYFSSEQFAYYLPGIMVATLREGCSFLWVVSSIIGTLDLVREMESKATFGIDTSGFSERIWRVFTAEELRCVWKWVECLKQMDDIEYTPEELLRVQGRLEDLVKDRE